MAIEKFKFVSPGVQVTEIDDSIIPVPLPATGPVIIGNTAKGPIMQPVMISSISQLERMFGTPSNGNVGSTDVWRVGAATAPTLATYAARAFLQNSSPVTVIRLGGAEYIAGTHDANSKPGWSADNVYNVFAVSGSQACLIANIYADSAKAVSINGDISGSVTNGVFNLNVGTTPLKVSLDSTKQNFIRNVLNTNPSKYSDSNFGYFLGETFETSVSSITPNYTGVLLTSSSTGADFYTTNATSAETGYVVDDLVSGSNSYNELFKFVGLNSGNSLARDIKISIENVKASKNLSVTKYGTFDVVIRKLFETQTQSVLERFADLSLDPTSDNYIARRIGDTYRAWNSTARRYEEFGTYTNRSAFVRVVMSETSDPGPTALPHGFIAKGVPSYNLSSYGLTGSHPNIPVHKEKISLSSAKTKRFGLLSDVVDNADVVDINCFKSENLTVDANSSFLFHTRFISSSTSQVQYVSSSTTPYYNTYDILLGGASVSGSVLGFDMPLYGGSDGKDITVPEAFVSDYILSTGNETNNSAYRSVRQAIEIVSDADLMDMNVLCVPGLQNEELTDYMLEICKQRGDSIALIDLKGDYLYPHDTNNGKEFRPSSIADVVSALETRQIDNSYGAAYFPAVFVPAEGIFMPSSIAALGALGGTEGRSALWFAPAGFNRGGLNVGTAGISVSRTALQLVSSDRDTLYNININPIATFPNEGVVIFGQKTLQRTPSALDRVNVRRLVCYVKKQISRAATRVLFEPNLENTWNSFKGVVEPFLQAIKNGYGLDDARVFLDASTTTADLIDRNTMYCKIFLRPTRAIEYIAIDFVVTNGGALFTE